MPLPLAEFRRLDLNAEEHGVTVGQLMLRAGAALASGAADLQGVRPGAAVFLCGRGNNGGDGFAAAANLITRGQRAVVVLAEAGRPIRGQAARDFLAALPADVVLDWGKLTANQRRELAAAGVLVDCLLGSGIRGEAREPYASMIRWINRQRASGVPVLACDIPSGLGTPVEVAADRTVTFHSEKEGMGATCGEIQVAPIGIPRAAATDVGIGDLLVGYARPETTSHKGDNGVLLIVGGGPYRGAPHYAGMAAYRAGVDLVQVWAPDAAARVIESWGPDLLVHAACAGGRLTMEGATAVEAALSRASALLLGPGLGQHPETRRAAASILAAAAAAGLPTVVDADGLDSVDPALLARHGTRMVLTPHAREFVDLGPRSASEAAVHGYARRHGVVVLRKGAVDVISDGVRKRRCRRGHPTMTVGGTGDVLAGTVGALLAKGASPFDASCAAAYLVGVAGELAAKELSFGATATDVLERIPAVLLRMDK